MTASNVYLSLKLSFLLVTLGPQAGRGEDVAILLQ